MRNNETLKKKIIYRSTHRGSKEMDLLLGKFVEKNIDNFSDIDLKDLANLLNINDDILQKWYFKNNNENYVPINKVSQLLKKFKL